MNVICTEETTDCIGIPQLPHHHHHPTHYDEERRIKLDHHHLIRFSLRKRTGQFTAKIFNPNPREGETSKNNEVTTSDFLISQFVTGSTHVPEQFVKMVQVYSLSDIPAFNNEPKAVLKQVVDRYKDTDLSEVFIEAGRIPEILSSLVPSSWDMKELQTLLDAVDEDQTGKLDLSKTSQVLIYFLKKNAEEKEKDSKVFTKVSLKISTQMCISSDMAMIIVYFYPQIMKAIDDGHCILQ